VTAIPTDARDVVVTTEANGGAPAPDEVTAQVRRVQRGLRRVLGLRVVLQALGAGVAAWLSATLAARAFAIDAVAWWAFALAVVVTLIGAMMLSRSLGAITMLRSALWIEEHGGTGFALVTWIEQRAHHGAGSPMLGSKVGKAAGPAIARAQRALGPLARAQLAGPAAFLFGATLVAGAMSWRQDAAPATSVGTVLTQGGVRAPRPAPLGAWRVRLTPPGYSQQPARLLGDTNAVRVLSGTRIELLGTDATPDSVVLRTLGDSATRAETASSPSHRLAPLDASSTGWRSAFVARAEPLEVRVSRDQFAKLLLVEGVADSVPRVTLETPARDSVMRRAEGLLPLSATLYDDLGLSRASFEIVISSGEGERFTVRTQQIGAQQLAGARTATLRSALDLTSLSLNPGDVVHLRAVARDAHPNADREAGVSETRSFRIARPSEYDSIAVEPAPPPDVDKSLLSQRMLLMLTERLEARRPRTAKTEFDTESRRLARDQGRMRQAVGDAVFQRLTGDAGGEHSHSVDDGHDHGVEAIGGKLALSGVNSQGMLEEGDDAPVIAINQPLLEAYNAMWDAGRALEQSDTRAAIPFMKRALEAIERARAASRLYLRGRPPTVIVDLAKVRLVGKDTGAPVPRVARTVLPTRSTAREARLLAAATLITQDPLAARDSLAVLRLESVADAPSFAEALSALLEVLGRARESERLDVTEPFLRARRSLGGVERVPVAPWSRGGPP